MRLRRKIAIAAVGTVAAISATTAAFAYWTSSGEGSGSAGAGTSSLFAVTSDAAVGAPLTPGGPTDTVAFHVKNNNSGHQIVRTIAISVANSNGSAWTSGSCSAADFAVTGYTATPGADLASGASWSDTVSLQMVNNTSAAQDDCKGVTVPLYINAG